MTGKKQKRIYRAVQKRQRLINNGYASSFVPYTTLDKAIAKAGI